MVGLIVPRAVRGELPGLGPGGEGQGADRPGPLFPLSLLSCHILPLAESDGKEKQPLGHRAGQGTDCGTWRMICTVWDLGESARRTAFQMLRETFHRLTFRIGRAGVTAGGRVPVTYEPSISPSVIWSPHVVFSSKHPASWTQGHPTASPVLRTLKLDWQLSEGAWCAKLGV